MTQRKVKFRAWETVSQSMVSWKELLPELSRILASTKQKNIIIMQSAGIKDKKGKEIYEGDIVKFNLGRECMLVCSVNWSTRRASFYLAEHGDERCDGNDHFTLTSIRPDYYEVIGNIYKNPKLLVVADK